MYGTAFNKIHNHYTNDTAHTEWTAYWHSSTDHHIAVADGQVSEEIRNRTHNTLVSPLRPLSNSLSPDTNVVMTQPHHVNGLCTLITRQIAESRQMTIITYLTSLLHWANCMFMWSIHMFSRCIYISGDVSAIF